MTPHTKHLQHAKHELLLDSGEFLYLHHIEQFHQEVAMLYQNGGISDNLQWAKHLIHTMHFISCMPAIVTQYLCNSHTNRSNLQSTRKSGCWLAVFLAPDILTSPTYSISINKRSMMQQINSLHSGEDRKRYYVYCTLSCVEVHHHGSQHQNG